MNASEKQKRLERYQRQRELYLKAEEAVLISQSYTIGTRTVTRADLTEIRKAKLNSVYVVDGVDMLAEVNKFC